jgi:hypothetical protein
MYSAGTAAAQRSVLVGTHGWTISDDGVNANWPTSGAFGATSNLAATSFTLNWTAGSDAVTPTANLEYFVCSGPNALAIDTAPECLASTQVMAWTANTLTRNITGKLSVTSYYYNVIMRDAAGDMVVYDGVTVTTPAGNDLPIISAISDQIINEDGNTGALNFTITDEEDPLNCATSMSKASSNATLVPSGNIVFAGTAPTCTVTVTPAAGEHGIATITLSVSDGVNPAVDELFQLTVNAPAPPSAAFAMNTGSSYANSTGVTLTLTDATDVTEYRKANSADCSAAIWASYSGAIAHTLAAGDGSKTVCLQVRNAALQSSTTSTDDISLDTVLPTSSPSVAAVLDVDSTAGANTTLSGAASDADSGVASVSLSIQQGSGNCLNTGKTAFDTTCPNWVAATGTTSWTLSVADALFGAATYTISSRATDNAANEQSSYGSDSFDWDVGSDGIPPTRPASLTLNSENLGITLSWPASAGSPAAIGYLLVRRSGSAVAWAPNDGEIYTTASDLDGGTHVVVYAGPNVNHVDAPLTVGTTYHYALFAYDDQTEYSTSRTGSAQVKKTIYRSVEVSATTALATGTGNDLNVTGSTATFTNGLPDKVGVGDALEYDYNNSGANNRIVFITQRISASQYLVYTAAGAAPTATTANDSDWKIFRAYTSLFNAESGAENTGITAGLRDFDTFTTGRDLVTNNEVWQIALYSNATADTTQVSINGWSTQSANYLRIFTPYLPTDVGTSQRHAGVWSTSHYRLERAGVTDTGLIRVMGSANHVRIEGLQLYVTSVSGGSQPTLGIHLSAAGHQYLVAGNIMRGSNAGGDHYHAGVEFWNSSGTNHAGTAVISNNIIYDFTSASTGNFAAGLGLDSVNTDYYLYNNTIYNCKDSGIIVYAGTATAINNIVAVTDLSAYATSGGSFHTDSKYNISDDATAPGTNAITNSTPTFVNAGTRNLLLNSSDTVAKNAGSDLTGAAAYPFSWDIKTKSRIGTWDIGADDEGVNSSLSLTYPNGGENIQNCDGSSFSLTWSSSALSGSVNIYDSTDGGVTWNLLFSNSSNDGVQSIPLRNGTNTNVRMKIESSSNPSIYDNSNAVFRTEIIGC